MKMHKKAAVEDMFLLVVVILFIAIGGIIATYVSGQIYTDMRSNPNLNSTSAAMDVYDDAEALNNKWDYLILTVMLAFAFAIIITGYFIPSEPIFIILYLIAMLIGTVVCGVFQYIYSKIENVSYFITIVNNQFPITSNIMNNLTLYFIIIAALGMVAMYAKNR